MKAKNIAKQPGHFILITAFGFLLAACGGGGGSSDSPATTTVSQGVFVDSAVEGIRFETATQSGLTDAAGTFDYQPGETVQFYIGGILLGSAAGDTTLTPVDLVPGATDETNPQVTNILRFIQSLDSDSDLTNGIQITTATHTALTDQSLDFSLSESAFETTFGSLSEAMLGDLTLVTATDAQAHMKIYLDSLTEGTNNQGLGSITLTGADASTLGSSYVPVTEGSSTVQSSTAVTWLNISGASLGFSAVDNQLVAVTYASSLAIAGGEGTNFQLYTYTTSCWPIAVAAAECSSITLDMAGKRLTLNNTQLTPPSTSISTNYATGPITLNGTVYWE